MILGLAARAERTVPPAADSDSIRARRVAMGFYRPDKLPRALSRKDEALAALVKLEAPAERCSGVRISRAGHVLTASHCVAHAMTQASSSDVLDLRLLEHAQAATGYPGNKTWFYAGDDPTYLIFAGKGFSAPRKVPPDVAAMAGAVALLERVRAMATGDWAILAADGPKPSACMAADPRPVKDGDPLWALGYPALADRANRQHSGGNGVYATYGEAVRDARLSESFERFDPRSREVAVEMYQPIIDSGDMLLSNMDSRSGLSGGPMVNAQGELVGIRTAGGSDQEIFRNNSTYGVSVKKIFEDLRSAGVDPESIFDCPQAAAGLAREL